MGRITSSGCARNDRITLDFVLCDPIVPGAATRRDPEVKCDLIVLGAATRRDPTHQIKLLK